MTKPAKKQSPPILRTFFLTAAQAHDLSCLAYDNKTSFHDEFIKAAQSFPLPEKMARPHKKLRKDVLRMAFLPPALDDKFRAYAKSQKISPHALMQKAVAAHLRKR